MKNWDVFIIVSTFIIALALFSTEKIGVENMLSNLNPAETIIVMFKTITVSLVGIIGLTSMIIILLADILVSMFMRADFPIMHFLHDKVFADYFINWYWEAHSGSHILMACIILFGFGIINTYVGPVYRRKTVVYYKTKQNNYINH